MDNKCQYSCWGYYDGVEVFDIEEEFEKQTTMSREETSAYESRLFVKRSNACISLIWCGLMDRAHELNGRYDMQNIGIFSCREEKEEKELEIRKEVARKSPYFAVGFIQLKERSHYIEFENDIKKIEGKIEFKNLNREEEYCLLNLYYTYDDADAVVLLYTNSLRKLDDTLHKISDLSAVRYSYFIKGVAEQYLEDCKKRGEILENWNDTACFSDQKISHLFLDILTSGKKEVFFKLREYFDGVKGNVKFSLIQGRNDIRIDLSDITVKDMLILFLNGAIATHGNDMFGREIYNIETAFFMKDEGILSASSEGRDKREEGIEEKGSKDEFRFPQLVRKYQELMKEEWKEADEGTYADYCSLVQITNTLAQYEGFELSKDLFLLLYPSFYMFDQRLEQARKREAETKNKVICRQYIKESVCEFSNSVNSVIYHTVHSNQFFLMKPGYTGTTFLIPVKLCLMYLWVVQKEIVVLNDADHMYSCLLTPGLESRPETTLINMGLSEKDRLIHFSSSQRSLYMPRHFMIILTHEIAHYVGDKIRNRRLRLKNIIKTLAYFLAEKIVPEKLLEQEVSTGMTEDIDFCKEMKEKIQLGCAISIWKEFEQKEEEDFHATKIIPYLEKLCIDILAKNGEIDKLILSVGLARINGARVSEMPLERVIAIQERVGRFEENRERALVEQKELDKTIHDLVQVYREIFSDIAAFCILKQEKEGKVSEDFYQDFSDTFQVSEGVTDQGNNKTDIQKRVRETICAAVFGRETNNKKEHQEQDWDNIFSYCWTGKYLQNYAVASREAIERRIEQECVNEREEIYRLYNMFFSDDATCQEIYKEIIKKTIEYEQIVKEEWEK